MSGFSLSSWCVEVKKARPIDLARWFRLPWCWLQDSTAVATLITVHTPDSGEIHQEKQSAKQCFTWSFPLPRENNRIYSLIFLVHSFYPPLQTREIRNTNDV